MKTWALYVLFERKQRVTLKIFIGSQSVSNTCRHNRNNFVSSMLLPYLSLLELWEMESVLGPSGTVAMYWPIVLVPGDCDDGEVGGMKCGWQEKPKYSEKTCPCATLSNTNPTCQTRARIRARGTPTGTAELHTVKDHEDNWRKFISLKPGVKRAAMIALKISLLPLFT
jgi:hypothetical protein